MIITTIDNRHPVTVALAYAFKTKRVTPDRQNDLREELQDIVVETAKRFVGFKDIESVRRALDITLGILSLAVVHSTKGKEDPEKWADYLLSHGLKNLAEEAVSMAKSIAESSPFASFNGNDPMLVSRSLREVLLGYAKNRHPKRKDFWSGYAEYAANQTEDSAARAVEKLVRFLIKKLTGLEQTLWLQQMERLSGHHLAMPTVEETLNTLLLRFCVNLPLKGDITLKKDQFDSVMADYRANKASWIQKTKSRYDELVKEIPVELRPGLICQGDWFETHLSKGPPRVPKKWNLLRPIRDVSGIYHYQQAT